MKILPPVSIEARRLLPSRWDLLAAILVLGFIIAFADVSRFLVHPLSSISGNYLNLSPWDLPGYALRTSLRMLIALGVSLIFTFTYATWAAKSHRAREPIGAPARHPAIGADPGFPVGDGGVVPLPVAGAHLGAELACVFAIFTGQAWNMAFSFYQSAHCSARTHGGWALVRISAWARFWRIEAPFATPSLIWNMMMSMSGGWFFVTVAEAISVGNTNIALPGVGSWIAVAIAQKDLPAIFEAILAMMVVILIYDQLLFRPLVAWADRFRIDNEQSEDLPQSWALNVYRRSRLLDLMTTPFEQMMRWSYHFTPPSFGLRAAAPQVDSRVATVLWYAILSAIGLYGAFRIYEFTHANLHWSDLAEAVGLGIITLIRVMVLIALATLIWTPIGVYVGLRPRLTAIVQPVAQFLAAFPNNLLFPLVVSLIVYWSANPDVWLSPLIILGTQWYILFNVIAGAAAMPREFRDAAENFGVHGWLWWKRVALPAVFPFYVTGAITASGGAWNASVLAEVASWGKTTLHAHGLGAYISDATTTGDFHRVVLGITVMSFFVVMVNRILWRPLYWYAERKFKLS